MHNTIETISVMAGVPPACHLIVTAQLHVFGCPSLCRAQ
jgi:hypothetical protein